MHHRNIVTPNFPFLEIISCNGNEYIFDTRDNEIYEVHDSVEAKNFIDSGLNYKRPNSFSSYQEIEVAVKENAKTLILELTDKCNLRCTYCVFDDAYSNERSHGNDLMTEEVIENSIMNFSTRAQGEYWYLIFYGGEPLNAYKRIVHSVEYAKKNNFKVKFSLTTNGISLSKEKFDFFIENDFILTISIDGPKHINDRKRLTKNGKGSFDIILKNINNLKKYNEKYLKNKVLINCTVDDHMDLNDVDTYFNSNSFPVPIENIRVIPTIQKSNTIDSHLIKSLSKKRIEINDFEIEKISISEKGLVNNIYQKIKYRKLNNESLLGKKKCIPFSNRTYIRMNGDSQFCERIGDFERIRDKNIDENIITTDASLDFKSNNIINDFNDFKDKNCSKCFAYNFCELCPASFTEDNEFNRTLETSKCKNYREATEIAILLYINGMDNDKIKTGV